jgi:twitching motility two-component system response regulator PilG
MNATVRDHSPMLQPVNSIQQLFDSHSNGCLCIASHSIRWFIQLRQGKLIAASHSVAPFQRLELHLRRLKLTAAIETCKSNSQIFLLFKPAENERLDPFAEYRALELLLQSEQITSIQASELAAALTREVVELFLWLETGESTFTTVAVPPPDLCSLDLAEVLKKSQDRMRFWQSFSSHIRSPYQRPYVFSQAALSQTRDRDPESLQFVEKLAPILKGPSIRSLAAVLKQDDLVLAKLLYPYIQSGAIFLRDAQSPFDQLPRIPGVSQTQTASAPPNPLAPAGIGSGIAPEAEKVFQKTHTIACIDDSPTILNEIDRFLGNETFSTFKIDNPTKALTTIMRVNPDLILMDVGMPGINGYELCRLVRNHPKFKETPIVMVTGHTGMLNRAKAHLVGASDYLTKPFTQAELLDIVSKYLA